MESNMYSTGQELEIPQNKLFEFLALENMRVEYQRRDVIRVVIMAHFKILWQGSQ